MIKKFRSAVSNPTLLKEYKSTSPGLKHSKTPRELKRHKTMSKLSLSKPNSPRLSSSPTNGLASYTTSPSLVT